MGNLRLMLPYIQASQIRAFPLKTEKNPPASWTWQTSHIYQTADVTGLTSPEIPGTASACVQITYATVAWQDRHLQEASALICTILHSLWTHRQLKGADQHAGKPRLKQDNHRERHLCHVNTAKIIEGNALVLRLDLISLCFPIHRVEMPTVQTSIH